MPSMVDHRKCFQFEGLPVIPGDFKADTWIIYSPFLKKRIKITGRESFNNSLRDKLISEHQDFFTNIEPNKESSIITELYITTNTNYTNIKKSIFYSINKFLAENSLTIQFNIVTSSIDSYKDEILKVLKLIDILSKDIVKPQIILTTTTSFSSDFLKLNKDIISSLHFQVEDSNPMNICKTIKEYKEIINISVSFYVSKLNVFEIENFILCCLENEIKNINIEPVKNQNEAPLKEIFVLNLLKGIKASLNKKIIINSYSLNSSQFFNQLRKEEKANRTDDCCNCFANSLCKSDSDFQCYVTRNTVPSLIKCS